MTAALTIDLYVAFLVFCRLGACLMIMPGISSLRVPMQVRLFLALMLSVSLSPLAPGELRTIVASAPSGQLLKYVAGECLIGGLIGFLGRLYYSALQFAATAMANFIGLSQISGMAVNDAEVLPELASLVTVSATLLLFLMDLHWEIISALLASYQMLPVSGGYDAGFGIDAILSAANDAFVTAMRVSSPFLVYAIVVNLAIGVTNRLQPNFPVYFVSMPFVILGGLLLAYFSIPVMLMLFEDHFATWLRNG